MYVFIHTGYMSVDNGAISPVSFYFELAKAIGVHALTGNTYGNDAIEVTEEEWPIVEELLIENKMLYKIRGTHNVWQNVQTDKIRSYFPAEKQI